ncbi:hypothetical protein D3C86_1682880 [compost metagenome]
MLVVLSARQLPCQNLSLGNKVGVIAIDCMAGNLKIASWRRVDDGHLHSIGVLSQCSGKTTTHHQFGGASQRCERLATGWHSCSLIRLVGWNVKQNGSTNLKLLQIHQLLSQKANCHRT